MVQCCTGPASAVPTAPAPVLDVCGGLLELFSRAPGRAPGRRSGQGTDHPAAAVLALAAATVVAGMKGYTAITGWIADVSAGVLADLYLRAGCPCRKRRSRWSSGVLVLVDDASGPVVSPDPEGLEVGYLGWKRLERCGAG